MTQLNDHRNPDAPARRPAIAVVAVHGVGDHEPGKSALSVAELLLRLRTAVGDNEKSRYTSFRTTTISLPVKPAYVAPAGPAGAATRSFVARVFKPFRERSAFLSGHGVTRSAYGADYEFMRAQLEEYRSTRPPYETVRLEGQRLDDPTASEPNADVHVYELQWSELARLKWSAFTIAYQLYQVLFHIPHLGRQAVDHAAHGHPGDRWWRWYRNVHTGAVRWFTLVVPLIWLTMAATVLTIVPRAIKPAWMLSAVTIGLPASVVLILGARAAYRRENAHWAIAGTALAIIAAALTALGVALLCRRLLTFQQAVSLEWTAIATFAVLWIASRYETVRVGARYIAWGLQGPAAVVLAMGILFAPSDTEIVNRTLEVFGVEFLLAIGVWAVFYGFAALSALLGIAVGRAERDDNERLRVRRATWTARATLAMSGTAVLTLGLPAWAVVYYAFKWALPGDVMSVSPFLSWFGRGAPTYDAMVVAMFERAAGPGLSGLFILVGLLGIMLVWTVMPSVWAEVRPPSVGETFAGPMDANQCGPQAKRSERMGKWLSVGLVFVRHAMTALFIVMIVAPLATPLHWLTHWSWLPQSETAAQQLILETGTWLAASAIGLAAFQGRLKTLLLGFRPVLDAVLDVDNYLREHPRTNTPRARMAERLASLFRYLCKWRDATQQTGYDAIVFVAHSQGTVITTDYLRYLSRDVDPDGPDVLRAARRSMTPGSHGPESMPKLYLFTMGTPLRQLYSEAFPHLYSWVQGGGVGLAGGAWPDPTGLGLRRWVNAYRSGDYVGRELWHASPDPELYAPYVRPQVACGTDSGVATAKAEDPKRFRREFCIGVGAHTHYWDVTARAIAEELDGLIVEAMSE